VVHLPWVHRRARRTLIAVTVLDAAFWVICLVLVAAGATKLTDPVPLGDALRSLHVPGTSEPTRAVRVARAIGAAEMVLGVGGLAVGGALIAWLVACSYSAFGLVVVLSIRRGLVSCGCFGARSGAPSPVHAGVNLVSAAVAVIAAVRGTPALADGLDGRAAGGLFVVLGVLAAAVAVIVVDTHSGGATVWRHDSSGGTDD
jgi:hypothetical protein